MFLGFQHLKSPQLEIFKFTVNMLCLTIAGGRIIVVSDSQILEKASELAVSIKMWLYDWATGKWPILLSFLLACCIFFSAEETIKYLPIGNDIRVNIQKYAIYLSIPLLFTIAIIQTLQSKQTEKISSLKKNLNDSNEKVGQLREENDQLEASIGNLIQDMEYICNGYLYSLAKGPLEFYKSSKSDERITIYLHDIRGHFYSIGRYSSNPDYSSKSREIYPGGQGNIAIAWEKGLHFANDYPDPLSDPALYSERCLRDGISEEILKSIKMKSRLYFGYRISKGHNSIAVILIESTQNDRYNYKQLEDTLNEEKQYLCYLIGSLSKWMPNINEARERGF